MSTDGDLHLEPGFRVPYRIREAWEYPEQLHASAFLTVEFLARDGKLLNQAQLILSPLCADLSPASDRGFSGSLTFHPETQMLRFRIGHQVIGERTAPKSKPSAKLEWCPCDLEVLVERVSWRASAEGGHRRCALLYSNDAGRTWEGITPPINLDQSSVEVDFRQLPGGTAMLRVLVTDGFHTAASNSPPFRVHEKGIQLGIQTPLARHKFNAMEGVWFRGQAFDIDKRTGADVEMAWHSSLDGAIGRGGLFVRRLSEGEHEIVLSSPNRPDVGRATTNVIVGRPPGRPRHGE